jgi:hypothetical protein
MLEHTSSGVLEDEKSISTSGRIEIGMSSTVTLTLNVLHALVS